MKTSQGPLWAKFGRFRADLVEILPNHIQRWPSIGRNRAKLVRFRATVGRARPKFVQPRSTSGQLWSKPGYIWRDSGRIWLMSLECANTRPKSIQVWPNSSTFGPMAAETISKTNRHEFGQLRASPGWCSEVHCERASGGGVAGDRRGGAERRSNTYGVVAKWRSRGAPREVG